MREGESETGEKEKLIKGCIRGVASEGCRSSVPSGSE